MSEAANPNANPARRLRRRLAAGVLAIVGLAVLCWFAGTLVGDRDPLFRGKPESEWIKGLKGDTDDTSQWRSFGEEGVQVLVRGLKRAQRPGERAYRRLYRALPRLAARPLPYPKQDSTRDARYLICQKITWLGKDARSAVPIMVHSLRDEDVQVRGRALGFFSYPSDTESAVLSLMDEKEKARILPDLIRVTQEQPIGMASSGVSALKYFPVQKQTVTPVLLTFLKDPDIRTRLAAAAALNRVDPDAAKSAGVTPMVTGVAKNQTNIAAADYAIRILGKFHHDPEAAISTLMECLDSTDSRLAIEAILSLEDDGFLKYSGTILPALTNVARREDSVGKHAEAAIIHFQWDLERQAAK